MKCSEGEESQEVEAEAGGGGGDNGGIFRVRVSLERYFNDERSRCYMSVNRGRPVRALARRLRRTFSLPQPFVLISRGHLLPPDEPLALLAPDDPVEVIPTKSTEYQVSEMDKVGGCPSGEVLPLRRCSASPLAVAHDDLDGVGRPEPPAPREQPARAAAAETAPADLEAMKRCALSLLDVHEAPARRRRRVRRRRHAHPASATPGEVEPAAEDAPPAAEDAPPATVVVQNGGLSPRAARLVHPLVLTGPVSGGRLALAPSLTSVLSSSL